MDATGLMSNVDAMIAGSVLDTVSVMSEMSGYQVIRGVDERGE